MAAPVRVSATGTNHTVDIVYDQPLNESSPPLLSDYVIALGAVNLTILSVVVLNVAGVGHVYVGTTERQFPGLLSIGVFTAGRLKNLAGELAPGFGGLQIVNATGATDVVVPTLLAARLNGGNVELYFNEVLDPASIPAASAFVVEVEDSPVATVDPVVIYGIRASIPIAVTANAGETGSLTYTPPGSGKLRDIDGPNNVAAIAFPIALENLMTEQTGFWTTRSKVEQEFGEENTRIWSNKGDDSTTDADPAAWAAALARTDNKFNADFLNNDYDLADLTPTWLSTSPYAARIKDLAVYWAGTELYFARGLQDRTGGTDDEMRDKMQGWRNYVDAELLKMFDAGLDIETDVDAPGDADGFQFVPRVGTSDITATGDEFSR
jgi:hypothetical protein